MIAQMLIPIPELVIPTGTPINELNAKIELQPLIFKATITKCST